MVEEACNALAWIHSTAGLPAPTVSPFGKTTLEGMQRITAKLTVKKEPVTVEMLENMKDANRSNTLADLRLTTGSLLTYTVFLHFNKVVDIRPCDITRHEDMMVIHLPHSTTNQLQKGDKVAIAQSGNITYLVAIL